MRWVLLAVMIGACAPGDGRMPAQGPPSGVVAAPRLPTLSETFAAAGAGAGEDPGAAGKSECALGLEAAKIDFGGVPEVCEPLWRVVSWLGPVAREELAGLVVLRGGRGPCGQQCPDLATALLSDAALAFYRVGKHELHVLDAMFEGPRWRSGRPDAEAVAVYLEGLGLGWEELVRRVAEATRVDLGGGLASGDSQVWEAIVARGPAILLGKEVDHEGILLHELGHALLLNAPGESWRVMAWASLSGWCSADGEPATGQVAGIYSGERPIVASRLALGLGRGTDAFYRPAGGAGAEPLPTGYAAFDPMEDHAEALRLLRDDPARLGALSPGKFLVMLSVVAGGRGPDEVAALLAPWRRFIEPGLASLLREEVDPFLAMPTIEVLGEALLPEAGRFHDARPILVEAGASRIVKDVLPAMAVQLGEVRLRPSDAALRRKAAWLEVWAREREEIDKAIESLDPPPGAK